MNNLKTIFLSLLIIIINQVNLSATEVGTKHEYGLNFLASFEYEEPKLMHLRGGSQATDDQLENIGILYNYKNAFINDDGYLNELEIDTSFQRMTQSYWSNGTGTMKENDIEVYNLRGLYGIQLSDKLMLKSGIGYRYHYHTWEGRQSTTGAYGYDREQEYTYIPIIAELKMPIPEMNIDGKLTMEFDHIFSGTNNSYQGYLGGGYSDLEFTNNDGYIWKTSYETKIADITFEPYYEFMSVETSNVVSSSHEPANTTKEIGLNIKKVFNGNERTAATDYKKVLLSNDNFYFGAQILKSEVETGIYALTGTSKIDDDNYGYSLVTGMKVLDEMMVMGQPIKLDVELAYNQFGEAAVSCQNGDTYKTDGRYNNGAYNAGTTLTCSSSNNDVIIESYSTSVGIKPSINLSNGIFVSTNLGFNRWNQSEHDVITGTNIASATYTGLDTYKGLGIGLDRNNLTISLEYLEHNMYYDAESMAASLKYNF
jgi:hypothetical protein